MRLVLTSVSQNIPGTTCISRNTLQQLVLTKVLTEDVQP